MCYILWNYSTKIGGLAKASALYVESLPFLETVITTAAKIVGV
jgi:hypothetical protein